MMTIMWPTTVSWSSWFCANLCLGFNSLWTLHLKIAWIQIYCPRKKGLSKWRNFLQSRVALKVLHYYDLSVWSYDWYGKLRWIASFQVGLKSWPIYVCSSIILFLQTEHGTCMSNFAFIAGQCLGCLNLYHILIVSIQQEYTDSETFYL